MAIGVMAASLMAKFLDNANCWEPDFECHSELSPRSMDGIGCWKVAEGDCYQKAALVGSGMQNRAGVCGTQRR